MRSLFKLALIGAAALALFAGGASAQDATVKTGFSISNVFGMMSDGTVTKTTTTNDTDKIETASSRYQNEFQTDVDLTGTAGAVTARAKIRFRDAAAGAAAPATGTTPVVINNEAFPNTNRADIYWKVNDLFTLGFMARSLGLPASSVAYSVYNSSTCSAGCTIGEVTAPVGFFANVRGLDFRFNVAGMTIGALLTDDCVAGCGYKTTSTGPAVGVDQTATKDKSSMAPYFLGAFGPVTLGAYLINSTGLVPGNKNDAGTKTVGAGAVTNDAVSQTIKDADTAVTGAVTDVNLAVDLGMAKIAFEVFTVSMSCNKDVLNNFGTAAADVRTCSAQDTSGNVIGARVNAGPGRVEAHMSTVERKDSFNANDAAGTKIAVKKTTSDLMVGYAIPINANFTINPLYASNTDETTTDTTPSGITNSKKVVTQTRTFIALGARAAF